MLAASPPHPPSPAAGGGARFVYDTPHLFDDEASEHHIWRHDGSDVAAPASIDLSSRARAQADGVAPKSVRGDLSALVLSQPSTEFSTIGLTVTRSLGDVYMQAFGVTWEPEVHVLDLGADAGPGSHALIVAATDGVWDLWQIDEVAHRLWSADSPSFTAFCDATLREARRKFADDGDDATIVAASITNPPRDRATRIGQRGT